MVPQGFGLIREIFGDEGQQKAFGIFGPIMGMAAIAGPLAGGGLIAVNLLGLGWRAIFLINVPHGLSRRWRRESSTCPDSPPATPHARLDVPSVALAAAGWLCARLPADRGTAGRAGRHGRSRCSPPASRSSARSRCARAHGRAVATPRWSCPSILSRRGYVAGLAVAIGFLGAMGGITLALNVMYQGGHRIHAARFGAAGGGDPGAGNRRLDQLLDPAVAGWGAATMHIGIAVMATGIGWHDLGAARTRAVASAPGRPRGRSQSSASAWEWCSCRCST